jgi:hypothetical protein
LILIFDIYLFTAIGFHPVAVIGRLVQTQERDSTKGETIQNNTKTPNIQNKKQKKKKHKRNIEKV